MSVQPITKADGDARSGATRKFDAFASVTVSRRR